MPRVEYMTVTGLWSHIIDDGIVDGDPNPDVVHPTGKVVFAPKLPAGFVVGGSPAENVTIAELPALIAGGILTDLQGHTGVKLPKSIDGAPIRWVAKPDVRYGKQTLASRSVTFDPPTTGSTLHLNDLFDDIGELSPLVTNQVKTYRDEARAARDDAQQILDDVEAGVVPDSAIASKITTTGTNTRAAVDARADARIGAANLLSKTVADATYATTSQGAKADSAVQPAALSSGLAGKANTTHAHTPGDITALTEYIQDAVDDLIQAGANVTKSYDDAANTLTIAATGGGGGGTDAEVVRDTIAGALVASTGINIAVDDGATQCFRHRRPRTGLGPRAVEPQQIDHRPHSGSGYGLRAASATVCRCSISTSCAFTRAADSLYASIAGSDATRVRGSIARIM